MSNANKSRERIEESILKIQFFLTMAANYQNDPLQSLRDSFPEGGSLNSAKNSRI